MDVDLLLGEEPHSSNGCWRDRRLWDAHDLVAFWNRTSGFGKSGMSKGKAKLGPGVAFLAIGTIAVIATMLALLSFSPK